MRLHFSKPPHCRTGHSRGDRYSPAWDKADEIVALYRAKDGHKTIAKRLGISPRIAREILIKRGEWKPRTATSGRKGMGIYSRFESAEKTKHTIKSHVAIMKRRVRACLNKKPPKPKRGSVTGAPRGLSNSEYCAWRYKNNPAYRVKELLRQRMKKVIIRGMKKGSSLDLIGCSSEHARRHIESQFKQGMHWGNSGTGKGLWHIDHIVPCKAFDLTRENQQRICFHFTNLRPMWSRANIRKGCKVNHLNSQTMLPLS
jgi:hypothetical protein